MPVYVCKAGGEDTEEPWKHVVQVYAEPFYYESDDEDNGDEDEEVLANNVSRDDDNNNNATRADGVVHRQQQHHPGEPQAGAAAQDRQQIVDRPHRPPRARVTVRSLRTDSASNPPPSALRGGSSTATIPIPIRRVRHSEIVLVDCVFVSHGRYWLRLVFPGDDDGGGSVAQHKKTHEYAGCIALQSVSRMPLRQALLDHMESMKHKRSHNKHHHNVPEFLFHDVHDSPKSRRRQVQTTNGAARKQKGNISTCLTVTTDEERQNAMMHYLMDHLTTKTYNRLSSVLDEAAGSGSHTGETTTLTNLAKGQRGFENSTNASTSTQEGESKTAVSSPGLFTSQQEELFELMHADVLLAIMMARGTKHNPFHTKKHGSSSSGHMSLTKFGAHVAQICEHKRREWMAECTTSTTTTVPSHNMTKNAEHQPLMTQEEFHHLWQQVLLHLETVELTDTIDTATSTSTSKLSSLGGDGNSSRVLCYETGLFFPSNPLVLELLPEYDDGLKLKEHYLKQKLEKEKQRQKLESGGSKSHASFLGSLTSSTRSVLFDDGSKTHEEDDDEDAEESPKVEDLDHELSDDQDDQILLGPSAGAETDVDEDVDVDDDEDVENDDDEEEDDDDDGPHGDEELIAVEPVFCRICREGIHDVEFEGGVESPPTDTGAEGSATTATGTARRSLSPLPPPPPPLHQMEFQQQTRGQRQMPRQQGESAATAIGGRRATGDAPAPPNTAAMLPPTAGGFSIFEDAQESHDHDVDNNIIPPSGSEQTAGAVRDQADTATVLHNNARHDDRKPSVESSRPSNAVITTPPAAELFPAPSFLCQPVNVDRLKKLIKIHPYVVNPMIAPCKCTGSMAFVHHLCVEQWRARSRHPDARMGRNCETCKAPYTLPPPTLAHVPENERGRRGEGDGLPGGAGDPVMAPHVLQALGRPHLWWRIGVFLVQKPYLRPLCPILLSPLVAMYCRARRTLKKRGVSRRRWSCSLCRRRARWKCVRCLRSYYCSRQCQNVSWHILHKHVCYKPSRFWGSVAAYSLGVLVLLPDIRTFPLLYILGVFWCIPYSFTAVGVLGGSLASVLKKACRVDVRGRYLELSVVFVTAVVSRLLWGLLWGYFGYPQYCTGLTMSIHDWFVRLSAVAASFNMSYASKIAKVTSGTYIPWYLLNTILGALGAIVVIPLDMIGTMISLVNKRVDNSLRQYFWIPVARTLTRTNVEYGQKTGLVYSLLCSNVSVGQDENRVDSTGIGGFWNSLLESISDNGWLSSSSSKKEQTAAEEKTSVQQALHRWMMEALLLQPGADDLIGLDSTTDNTHDNKIDQAKKEKKLDRADAKKEKAKKKDEKDTKRKSSPQLGDQNVNKQVQSTQEGSLGGKATPQSDIQKYMMMSSAGGISASELSMDMTYEIEDDENWKISKSSFPSLFSSSRTSERFNPTQIDAAVRLGFGVTSQGDSRVVIPVQSSSSPSSSSTASGVPPKVCFKQLQYINPDFTLENKTCAADLQFLAPLLQLAAFCALFGLLWAAIVAPAFAAANAARRRRRGGGGGGGGGGFAARVGLGRRPFNGGGGGGGVQQRMLVGAAPRRQEGRGGPAVAQVDRAIRMARRRMAEQQARNAAAAGGGVDAARGGGNLRNNNFGAGAVGDGNAPEQQAQEEPLHLHQD